ncbi:hypothetical protein VSS74_17500 [Conexibacter stalactiti]|uniref:DUF7973 domain-containing protein n=1 Tax=Conexibacter stalactiti TaxID=1940611 RepID=A0ABU4HS45_9ACTN|nr:hypothetical protein [Conexibacter stalactiti]MDW5596147.1 hypothetical protein [Conexibacter stalactiti]MEC5036789.1 hypothetical protein [Conexibacter stalactiti]
MDFSLSMLLAAFAGGCFGALCGALIAFALTGAIVLLGAAVALAGGRVDVLGTMAFGPVFGPHVAFAGAVAAVAYAARRGYVETGRDIATPLASLGKPDPIVVGGLFGVGGYAIQQLLVELLAKSDGTGFYTDTVALSVGITAVVARFAFGAGGLLGARPQRRARPIMAGGSQEADALGAEALPAEPEPTWVPWQRAWSQAALLGLISGIASAWVLAELNAVDSAYVGAATLIGFGVSASLLALLVVGASVPVTHHMTLPAAVAAGFVAAAGGSVLTIVAVGALCGVLGALLGELCARLFLIHGDTHVDPPALAIALMTTAIVLTDLAL